MIKGLAISAEMFVILKWLITNKKDTLSLLIKEAVAENFKNKEYSSLILEEANVGLFTKILQDLIEIFEIEIDNYFINSPQKTTHSPQSQKKENLIDWQPEEDDAFA